MMKFQEWREHLEWLEESIAMAESELEALKDEWEDHLWVETDEPEKHTAVLLAGGIAQPRDFLCAECNTPISHENHDGICYQCQCELHALGIFNMDAEGPGWK